MLMCLRVEHVSGMQCDWTVAFTAPRLIGYSIRATSTAEGHMQHDSLIVVTEAFSCSFRQMWGAHLARQNMH